MFAARTKKTLTYGEDTITVRKLSGSQIDQAHEVKNAAQVKSLRALGGELMSAMRSPEDVEAAKAKNAAKDKRQVRIEALDRSTVLVAGIDSWSDSKSLTPENVAGLEEDVSQKTFEAIIDLTYGTEDDSAKS
jgi:hypothetical protein